MKIFLKMIAFATMLSMVACGPNVLVESRSDEIVDVPQTPVERQTIGNCWLYAHASWAESMHLTSTGDVFDISQSYWTYMHWFEQIVSGSVKDNEISTGGTWNVARSIVLKYGLMSEEQFILEDTNAEQSHRQLRAMQKINAALAEGGELAEDTGNRLRREVVRDVFDEAWGLHDEHAGEMTVSELLDTTFGEGFERNFTTISAYDGEVIVAPYQFEVAYTTGPGTSLVHTDLSTAFNQWRSVNYSRNYKSRQTLTRMQRALHDRQPLMITWLVDFNALEYGDNERKGSFNLTTLEEAGGPGRHGGHMTVLEDYEAIIKLPSILDEVNGEVAKDERVEYSFSFDQQMPLTVTMTGSGDADLYVRMGESPDTNTFDCRPYKSNSDETCIVQGPGAVFVAIHGYRTSTFRLTLTYAGVEEILKADVTLDPSDPDDAAKINAALADDTEIVFLRIKNSWGANRLGLPFAPGPHLNEVLEKGYHDLYKDYLDGPIADKENCDEDNCPKTKTPLWRFIMPPGY
jgi:hypothetical protein